MNSTPSLTSQSPVVFRVADGGDDQIIATHFYAMWRDNDIADQQIHPDWLTITLEFIYQARQTLQFQTFVAEVDGNVIGSASCQLFAGLYPHIILETYRKYGYIWGVYVEPAYRGRGYAKTLTKQAIAHLKSLNCTRVILHASPSGKPVYTNLGFTESNEMRLELGEWEVD